MMETQSDIKNKVFKIGTRASPLAVAQVDLLIAALKEYFPDFQAEIVKMTTTGDKIQDRSLMEAGGKGLFTKEIEDALIRGDIDMAVHSMKDMPTVLPDGLVIPCYLPREDERDVFMSVKYNSLDDLPNGAKVGTASLRRQAIVLAQRPDLKVEVFRGNVGTRMRKLEEGIVDATMLAAAGLRRLGMMDLLEKAIDPSVMLPAVAQGAIGIEIRKEDTLGHRLLEKVHCPVTDLRVTAERAYLAEMDGSCRTPIAALAQAPDENGIMSLDVLVARPDGTDLRREAHQETVTNIKEAHDFGAGVGRALRATLPEGYFREDG